MQLPTIPATPSVALSASDRAFILKRRRRATAGRCARRKAVVLRALVVASAVVWAYNFSLIFGGA